MTEEQFSTFGNNGFLKIENALSPDELRELRAATERVLEDWRADTSLPGVRRPELEYVSAIIEYDGALLRLLWHPTVLSVAQRVLGDDIMMIANACFIAPPHTVNPNSIWHYDINQPGVYHPLSILMVKVLYLLTDVEDNAGGVAVLPGSHRMPMDVQYMLNANEREVPGGVQLTGKAGTAFLYNARIYHAVLGNESENPCCMLVYTYGHYWMKQWSQYEPSQRLLDDARSSNDLMRMQLLGLTTPYLDYLM